MNVPETLQSALEGRYAIEREIGSGGMATVYLARDLRHERLVALKVLRPELGAVLGVERFLAEIRVTANLQHPHLLPLFDSGEAGGLLFYVMPYVAGESLRARLDREHQLGIDEAVRIATAVASALDYAHRNNVVHRDLKPENILLNDGEPVVSDFGIALAVSNAGGMRVTQTGLSLGTPAYMSPEQASGDRTIDARSDVYSLGAVTYEMLSGEPPHTGANVQQVISRVLTEVPRRLRDQRSTVPEHVDEAVHHALAKLPADRPASAREFSDELNGISRPRTSGARSLAVPAASPRRARIVALLPWVVAATAVVAALVKAGPAVNPESSAPLVRFSMAPPGGLRSDFADLAISPDGRRLLLTDGPPGSRKAWLRSLGEDDLTELTALAGTQGHFFSPTGTSIGFVSEGKLRTVPVGGGASTVVATVGDGPFVHVASWGSTGVIVYGRSDSSGLRAVAASGGTPRRVTTPDSAKGEEDGSPSFLPDGAHFLFERRVRGPGEGTIMLGALDGPERSLGLAGAAPRLVADHLVYLTADGAITAADFDVKKGRVSGAPILLLTMPLPPTGRGPRRAAIAGSLTGVLAFVEASPRRSQVVVVDRGGAVTVMVPTPRNYGSPVLSPDGRNVAVEVADTEGNLDIWVFDASGTSRRITRGGRNQSPVWSQAGDALAWGEQVPGGSARVLRQRLDGLEGPDTLMTGQGGLRPLGFAPAGDSLRVVAMEPRSPARLMSVSLRDGGSSPYAAAAGERGASLSPDGRWMAYSANEEGKSEVFVRPSMAPSPVVRVSPAGGEQPRWSQDGRALVYRDSAAVVEVDLAFAPTIRVTGRRALVADTFERSGQASYAPGPGGRLVMLRAEDPANHVDVLVNVGALIRQKAALLRRTVAGQ